MSKQTPSNVMREFRVGSIWVTIYAKEAMSRSGAFTQYSVRIERHWMDEKGHWCTTNFFVPKSLPELALAANKAYEFVSVHETEALKDRPRESSDDDQNGHIDSASAKSV